jgi:hypothetical protein
MHVQQHLLGIHVFYNQLDLGTINADPSYDLVIHHNDAVCPNIWCLHVENFDGGAAYSSGVTEWLVDLFDPLIDLIEHEVNASLTDEFKNTTGLPDLISCFPGDSTTTPVPLKTKTDQNHPVTWDIGSITLCSGYIPQD